MLSFDCLDSCVCERRKNLDELGMKGSSNIGQICLIIQIKIQKTLEAIYREDWCMKRTGAVNDGAHYSFINIDDDHAIYTLINQIYNTWIHAHIYRATMYQYN